jgi:hypothetical protein
MFEGQWEFGKIRKFGLRKPYMSTGRNAGRLEAGATTTGPPEGTASEADYRLLITDDWLIGLWKTFP